jgi:hypothetical protein
MRRGADVETSYCDAKLLSHVKDSLIVSNQRQTRISFELIPL